MSRILELGKPEGFSSLISSTGFQAVTRLTAGIRYIAMKNKPVFVIVLGIMFFCLSCKSSQMQGGSAESEVLYLDDQRYAARQSGDADAMSRIYADDYTLITAEGVLRSKADQINEMRSQQLRFNPIEILDRNVRVYGDTAIVLAHEHSSIIRNGQEIGGDFRTTRVYVRRGDRWQLEHTQATRIEASGQ